MPCNFIQVKDKSTDESIPISTDEVFHNFNGWSLQTSQWMKSGNISTDKSVIFQRMNPERGSMDKSVIFQRMNPERWSMDKSTIFQRMNLETYSMDKSLEVSMDASWKISMDGPWNHSMDKAWNQSMDVTTFNGWTHNRRND